MYRLRDGGRTWLLEATPGAKYPWLLHTGQPPTGYVCQEIGVTDPRQAQGMAELWIDLTRNYPYPPRE